jgi:uncharacterized protein (DUF885 family)
MSSRHTAQPELASLFTEWRAFERPPLRDGAPDYSLAQRARWSEGLVSFRHRLEVLDHSNWPVSQQVDWHLLRAELNGLDFNLRVMRPWERDPAFYVSVFEEQSDVPAREGPTHHAAVEVWQHRFPLTADAATALVAQLARIPPLLAQARVNLTGNARDLWVAGAATVRAQLQSLDALRRQAAPAAGSALDTAITAAHAATLSFADWLDAEAPRKTGPSGIGRENYDWYQRNVRYVPLSWEDELRLLERELARAWNALAMEETRNRGLPELEAADTPEAWTAKADAGATRLMHFLRERQIMPLTANMEPALREKLGPFVPPTERNFFDIGRHLDPVPLYCHFYHWFDLARVRDTPSPNPFRREALLYNIFDSYSEGIATAVEEMFMHAGLLDDAPRAREIVWIMLAQRAARGIGSLRAHANEMSMAEAGQVHLDWTPRNWMRVEPKLLQFEQHLYLRQPGYGTSYLVGKYLIEQLVTEHAKQCESTDKPFVIGDFFREFQDAGAIPVALLRWELTGQDDQVRALAAG